MTSLTSSVYSPLAALVAGASLNREEARVLCHAMVEGRLTPVQIAGILIALRIKGETPEEVSGFVTALMERMQRVHCARAPIVDTCGTGGAARRVFNVSTAAAFVAAAAGVIVAKHGNRAASGVCGSADVLEALGIPLDISAAEASDCLERFGICFLFARAFHPAVKAVAPVRAELGTRTIFNMAAPLANPAYAQRRVMGVYDADIALLAARALQDLGIERSVVVFSHSGMAEIDPFGRTRIIETEGGEMDEYVIDSAELGLPASAGSLDMCAPAAEPAENARMVREAIATREQSDGAEARRLLVAVNAAAAIRIVGLADTWPKAVEISMSVIESGAALDLAGQIIDWARMRTPAGSPLT